ncbi:MAG: hypothetical protein LWW95_08515 [Candidatus Desulfofervidus auxilii]|nr:hypothetical protein [Candidatus Desulfofervidus auxilii]
MTITPYVSGSLTYTHEKAIFLNPKKPKHKRLIKTFLKDPTLEGVWIVIPRGYPFFYSSMPFLLFFKKAQSDIHNIIFLDEKIKKQILFLETFITALGAVKGGH